MGKVVCIVGGVYSACGKGLATASIGFLLKQRNLKVQAMKFDPYLNSSCSLINPGGISSHGELWVCDDGSESDLDLGTYYRYMGIDVGKDNIYTSGKLYKELITREETGQYMGHSLQVIPHLTNLIQEKINYLSKDSDVLMVEIGGTINDIESSAYYEAIRQLKQKNPDDVLVVVVAPILWINTVKEFKTKPLQNSIKDLKSLGVQPDILLCRVENKVPDELLDKISTLTNINREAIFQAPDVKSIYQVPIEFYDNNVDSLIVDKLRFKRNGLRIRKYRELVENYINNDKLPVVDIGIVGKYANCEESYTSIKEALYHSGVANNVQIKIKWISAEEVETEKDKLIGLNGVIIPGGFGNRAISGKIKAIQYCRENKIPLLGICLGLQCSVIEFARNVLKLKDANSLEFDGKTPDPVIHYVEGQENLTKKSGTMRLGAYDCELTKGSLAYDLYGKKLISERHRHRYEVNPKYVSQLVEAGFNVTGINPESKLVEVMELKQELHPYFIATQAHPEFKSRLTTPAPLFVGLVKAAINFKST